ncbi:hypothetical protein, partial [Amycolatopsis saalfeldensis]|uniref:hypothetical protein n=1 Tax=Amycolatopsis saalfeldensis TaxID=394193 RepID=UPI001C43060D
CSQSQIEPFWVAVSDPDLGPSVAYTVVMTRPLNSHHNWLAGEPGANVVHGASCIAKPFGICSSSSVISVA